MADSRVWRLFNNRDLWTGRKRQEEQVPKVSDVYGGQYLKASMIGDDTFRMEIKSVTEEEIGQEQERKLVVYFRGTDKGLVLNATNANTLAENYGDDTDGWVGKVVKLYTTWTEFGGRRVKGLRVDAGPAEPEKPKGKQAPWERGKPEPKYEDELEQDFSNEALSPEDDLPF